MHTLLLKELSAISRQQGEEFRSQNSGVRIFALWFLILNSDSWLLSLFRNPHSATVNVFHFHNGPG
jgi:hypothetical protein